MENQLFNLRYAAKNLQRSAAKCEKAEKEEQRKIKIALTKNNHEGARIHAENSIRQKNQAVSFLRMAARVDAVCARVQTAITLKGITQNMSSVVKSMDAAAKSMDLEKLMKLMDSFEKNFENLDVQSQVMDSTMSNTVTLSTPEDQVSGLMKKVADEAGIELTNELPGASQSRVSVSAAEEDDLSQRLARLRQP
ncbi:Charged multivesicular body protein 1 [Fasciola gigantica]|uniref:Charged multivesicular body protein 1 n=1 Tax=Fasciola gigantica TaxID=46835 RepID=A0A504YYJ8_FASGI|nr:Charged multivesicular body protein 1 [Fasciola gigantica]